jgi:3-oxoacyl-[acyl-carrier protein] reductase
MNANSINLKDKKILITGVSRPMGIGATLARRLAEAGAAVAVHGFSDYDMELGFKTAMPNGTDTVARRLIDAGLTVTALEASDLEIPGSAEAVVNSAAAALKGLDGLILNHAYSTYAEIGQWTPKHIDSHLLVNVRASMMMIQAFAAQADSARDNAVTLFTSGQYLGPMINEIAYCVSKEAIICLCRQCSYALADRGIRVNCVNPGPNDTGYCTGDVYEAVAKRFPAGRWGTPDDAADLVLFLHSHYAKWITGQVIASDGGVRE